MRWVAAGAYALAGLLLLRALGSPAAPGPARASLPARATPVEPEEAKGSAPADGVTVFVPATARASRPFLLEVAGCEPSGVRLLQPATGAQPLPGPGPFARLRLTLAEEGWQRLEVAAPGCGPLLAWVRVGPPVPIGWSGPLSPFAAALEEEGFRIETGEVLQGDLLVLAGVPEDSRAIERFAREGGGVLLLGREAVQAVGREEWSPVEALPEPPQPEEPASPPESPSTRPAPGETPPEPPAEPPEKKAAESATVTLLLLIDRSGSMAGVKIERAKEAALASAETLDPQDQVAVIAFDATAEEVCALGPAGDRERIRGCVAPLGAGGGTRFEPALKKALEIAGTAPPGIRHVVLLSDGMTEDWGAVDYRTLIRGGRALGVTVSTVGFFRPGDRGDEPLALLARWGGGRFYPVSDPREVPQVFTLEARRVAAVARAGKSPPPKPEAPPQEPEREPPAETPPPATAPARFTVAAAIPHEALSGVDISTAPPFEDYVRASSRPRSQVLLRVEPTGDPLLSLRPLDSGWVAAWCGDGGEGAFAAWVASGHLPRLAASLAEFLRRAEGGEVGWSLEAFGEKGILTRSLGGGEAPPDLLSTARPIDAATGLVRLDPPLRGMAGPDLGGRLRSSLRRVDPEGASGPAAPEGGAAGPPALMSAPLRARGSGLLLAGAALALALGEGSRRIPTSPQRRSPRPSLRVGGSGAGGSSRTSSR